MAKPRSIAAIVTEAANQPDLNGKVWVLRNHDHPVLRNLLRMAVDPNVPWLIPEGDVPYKPCEFTDQENMLYKEARLLYLFLKGGNDNLKPGVREMKFIQLLENLDPRDAKFVVDVRNHKLPPGLDINVIRSTWPGLI